jgi:hypothetical protein
MHNQPYGSDTVASLDFNIHVGCLLIVGIVVT